MEFDFSDSVVMITGGTGSFGQACSKFLLQNYNLKKLIIFSRDEMKQWEMAKSYHGEDRIRFFIGDVRDQRRLHRALDGVDYVIHAAATKIVPTAEYNPFECVKTNVIGAMNLIEACLDQNVKKVVALSTDKASSPANLYGATKLTSDKLFVAANAYSGEGNTRFSVVRYGNVMGSRGSVIPFFLSQLSKGFFPITNMEMTRFMITLKEGVDLVIKSFEEMYGGEIFIKKIPSMGITDIARAVSDDVELRLIGVRPGEKLHEQMIGIEDAPNTYEYADHFRIISPIFSPNEISEMSKEGKKVAHDFCYTSNNNTEWMSVDNLRSWIDKNKESFL